jgi:hypothetical protein
VVTEAEIEIDNDVILDGEGILIVEASSYGSVFSVGADVAAELIGMTVTGSSGSGISNGGMLALTNATVSGNSRGGIGNSGTLTLTNSTVSGNTANGSGGGGILSRGTVTLTHSTVAGNTAVIGGGILNEGTLSLIHSTVSGNTATDIIGGGILNFNEGTLTLTNTTVSGNTARERDGVVHGSGIFNEGTLSLINSTISGNNVASAAVTSWQGTVVDSDCILEDDPAVATISNGYNIESPGDTCGFDPDGTDLVDVPDPMLGPLQDNGGPTETHALLGVVGVDVIPEVDCVDADGLPLTTDQRGEPRPVAVVGPEPKCDVGAFEVQGEE